MFQIIFNTISANEISKLDTITQLELLSQFRVEPDDLKKNDGKFGIIKLNEKDKKRKLYRYRAKDLRIYFEIHDENSIIVQRVLHKNTFQDFLFRSNPSLLDDKDAEDEELGKSKHFWKLIEEGENAKKLKS